MKRQGQNADQTDATAGPSRGTGAMDTRRQKRKRSTRSAKRNLPGSTFTATSHADNCKTVPQRPGTRSKGPDYEWEILLYTAACLSQNPKIKDFRILCNADGLGVWDDVVARISFEGGKNDVVLFVQAKHLEKKGKELWLQLGSCSPEHTSPNKKYEIDLTRYKQNFENLIKRVNDKNKAMNTDMCQFLADIQDHFACIFTNASVSSCSACTKSSLQSKKFNVNHPLYFLAEGNYQQFDFEKITGEDDRTFYKQLFIFSSQTDVKIADQLGPAFNESVLLNLKQGIQKFMEKETTTDKLICQILTKEEFEIKCLEAVLIHNNWLRHDVPKKSTHQISDKFKELWRKILSQNNIIINLVDEGIEGIRPLLASYYQYALNDNPKKGMQTNYNILFSLWREEKIPLSIKSEYTTNFFQVLKTCTNFQKRFIVFCDEDCPELTDYKQTESVMTYVNEIPDLQQIIPEILKVEVSLQGRDLVPLSEILGECEARDEILNKIPISQLLVWTMNIEPELPKNIEKSHRIGPELTRPRDNYLRRTFTLKEAEKNVEDEQQQLTEEDVLKLAKPGVHIITGDPGMGKSTVLRVLAHRYSPQNFVIYVKLSDCLHDIEDEDVWPNIEADPIQYLFQKMADNADDDTIAKSIMEIQKAGNRLGIFLDAFDEILPLHGERITSLIESILENTNVTIFCTTRPHAEKEITTREDAKCFELSPLTEEQIIECLTYEKYKYFRIHLDYKFLCNPLHLNMISQIYGIEDRDKIITEAEMYKLFIESQLKIFNDKKKLTKNDVYGPNRKIMKNLRILAMTDIFGLECVISKEVTSKDDLDKVLDDICDQNIGIGEVQETRRNFQFVHRTFAEYLVVEWLRCKEDQDILNRKYLKYFFNKIVAYKLYYIDAMLWSHNMDLWYTTRKYLLVNCVNEGYQRRWHRVVPSSLIVIEDKEFNTWLDGTDSQLNVTGPTLVDSVNNDHPTRKPLTEDHVGSSTKFLTAINAEYKPHIELVLKSQPTILETGLGIVAFNLAISTGNQNIVKLLLKSRPTLVDEQDVDGNTGLHIACGYGYSALVALLLKNNANMNINNNNSMTPLGMATEYGKLEIWKIEDIYNQKSVENSPSPNDFSEALLGTSAVQKWDIVEYLLEHSPKVSNQDWPVLFLAVENGTLQIIEMLLARGYDINAKSKEGNTPLAIACKRSDPDMVEWLLENGANPHLSNDDGWTAMHFAAKVGKPEIMEMLSAKGLDVNARTKNGETPFAIACGNRWNKDCVKWLLEHGANPKTSNDDGWTAMHFAVTKADQEIMEILAARGVDVNARTTNGITPLAIACSELWQTHRVEWLLEYGANPQASNDDGWTAMHFAANGAGVDTMRILGARGLDVNARTKKGETPLIIACSERWNKDCVNTLNPKDMYVESLFTDVALIRIEVVKWLLQHGANPKASNDAGWTAMHFAAKGGVPEFMEMLSGRGLNLSRGEEARKTIRELLLINSRPVEERKTARELLLKKWGNAKAPNDEPEITEMSESKPDVNQRTNDGQTPLAIARQAGRADLVDWLLQNGSDGS